MTPREVALLNAVVAQGEAIAGRSAALLAGGRTTSEACIGAPGGRVVVFDGVVRCTCGWSRPVLAPSDFVERESAHVCGAVAR